jgi:protein-disulfide isomerase
MCILTYGINFMLLYMFWMMKIRFDQNTWKAAIKEDISFWRTHKFQAFKWYSPLIVSTILIMAFIPAYWHMEVTDSGKQVAGTGITEEGDPWIGAQTPELTIIEYSDYMCFQCRKMHFFLRKLIAGYPEKIRLVHKHFPMDKKFNPMLKEDLHPGSGILSSIAVYAARENKFWELNDYLYHYNMGGNAIYLRKIAQESGLDLDRLKTGIHDIETRQKLQDDIIAGLRKNISGTPSYIINDKVYTGLIPSDVLNAVIK